MTEVRKGQHQGKLSRAAFSKHFQQRFYDPRFDAERTAISALEAIAWNNYCEARKSPRTQKAGEGFADSNYELSDEWRRTSDAIKSAQAKQADQRSASRVLLVCAADRNDGTCPGEMSKSYRLAKEAGKVLDSAAIEVDFLDLSELSSEFGRKIFPCKACVSTAMPLCHWPCSCYPNHSLGQTDDWMAEIYERLALAHGLLIVTPVYWGQVPGSLKLMMDRLVCADGGNPDPSSTHGKDAAKAKALELRGWPYPKHLAGRIYGIAVHGDTADVEAVLAALTGWLDWSGFVSAGPHSQLSRYIGYFEPYATSHDALDKDEAIVEEVRNVARAVAKAVFDYRKGRLALPDSGLKQPRLK